jgi:hypothetical protein
VDYIFWGTFIAPFFTNEMQPRLPKQQHTSIQQAEEEEDQPNFCSRQPPGNTEQLFAAK